MIANKKDLNGCWVSLNICRTAEQALMAFLEPIPTKTTLSTLSHLFEVFHFLNNWWNSKTKCNMLVHFFSPSFFNLKLKDISTIWMHGLESLDLHPISPTGDSFLLKHTMKILIAPTSPNITQTTEIGWSYCGRIDPTDPSKDIPYTSSAVLSPNKLSSKLK